VPYLKQNAALLTFVLAVVDSLVILGGYSFACWMVLEPGMPLRPALADHLSYFLVFVITWCAIASDQRLFASRRDDRMEVHLWDVLRSWFWGYAITVMLIAFFTKTGISLDQVFLPWYAVSSLVSLMTFRALLRIFLWSIRRHGYNYRQVMIIGTNRRAKHLVEVLEMEERFGYRVVGIIDDEPSRMTIFEPRNFEHLGCFADLERILKEHIIDEVFLTLPLRSHYETIMEMAARCEAVGVTMRMIADFFPLKIAKSKVHLMDDVPLLSMTAVPEGQLQLYLKRVIDVSGALFGLVFIAWWLFPIVAVLIKLQSKGPIFFLQERVGLNGRRFKMIKFRSMVQNAEELRSELEQLNEADGPVFKIREDPRITPIGKFLRKTSIDELPQLINVLVGQMSLVGPRPPIPSEVEEYRWDQRRRLSVKPGITGLWQVSGRSDLSFKEWVELDLLYIDTWSILEDFHILLKTIRAVLDRKGAA
jgi:exopolysaccharide biosynthesis polyprenyl glycosylphosphotransferase